MINFLAKIVKTLKCLETGSKHLTVSRHLAECGNQDFSANGESINVANVIVGTLSTDFAGKKFVLTFEQLGCVNSETII